MSFEIILFKKYNLYQNICACLLLSKKSFIKKVVDLSNRLGNQNAGKIERQVKQGKGILIRHQPQGSQDLSTVNMADNLVVKVSEEKYRLTDEKGVLVRSESKVTHSSTLV